jgi:UTP-glucose-1-phosphate uridylyltransferase
MVVTAFMPVINKINKEISPVANKPLIASLVNQVMKKAIKSRPINYQTNNTIHKSQKNYHQITP